MHETDPHEIDERLTPGSSLWGALTYEPSQPRFHVARKTLLKLGASYHHELRAWQLPTTNEALTIIRRLYTRTSLALYVAGPEDTITRAAFERYTGRNTK